MKPIVYEIFRIFRSKIFLGIIVLILALSIVLAAGLNYDTSRPSPNSVLRTDYGYYYENSSFHVVNWVHNAYGAPYQGASYNVDVNGHNFSAVSDNYGYANMTIPESSVSGVAAIDEQHDVGTSSFPYHIPLNSSRKVYLSGDNSYNVSYIVTGVYNQNNMRLDNILIYYLGENGSASPQVSVYWSATSNTFSNGLSSALELNSTLIKTVSGFHHDVITPNIPYKSGVYSNQKEFFITVTEKNSTVPVQTSAVDLIQEISPATAYEFIFSELGSTFQIFIPLVAIISAYQIYAYDRVTGIIESVIVRPITASQVMLSRYLSNAVALAIPIVASVEILNLFSIANLGVAIPLNMVSLLIWAFVVEALSFAGIIFVLSHLTRNNIRVIGFAVFLYIVFNMLWSVLVPVFGNGSTINYFSPGGYFYLVYHYVFTKLYPSMGGAHLQSTINWPLYLDIMFIGGILWISIPLLMAYGFSRKKD